jgi:NADH-quinone oxidoreductase subunit A
MTFFYTEIFKIGILLFFSIFLACFIIFLSYVFSTSNPDAEKLSAYECGFDPYEDARNIFDIKFYLIAILFIVFDLECIFFFPWSVSYSFLNIEGFWCFFDFVIELLIGFLYAWKMKSFTWNVNN